MSQVTKKWRGKCTFQPYEVMITVNMYKSVGNGSRKCSYQMKDSDGYIFSAEEVYRVHTDMCSLAFCKIYDTFRGQRYESQVSH